MVLLLSNAIEHDYPSSKPEEEVPFRWIVDIWGPRFFVRVNKIQLESSTQRVAHGDQWLAFSMLVQHSWE